MTLIDSDQRIIELLLELLLTGTHTHTHTHTALFLCVLIPCTQDLDDNSFHLPSGHALPAPRSEQPPVLLAFSTSFPCYGIFYL